jgi:hypothetical protein
MIFRELQAYNNGSFIGCDRILPPISWTNVICHTKVDLAQVFGDGTFLIPQCQCLVGVLICFYKLQRGCCILYQPNKNPFVCDFPIK